MTQRSQSVTLGMVMSMYRLSTHRSRLSGQRMVYPASYALGVVTLVILLLMCESIGYDVGQANQYVPLPGCE